MAWWVDSNPGSRDGTEGVEQTWRLGFAPRIGQGSSTGTNGSITAIGFPEVDVSSQVQSFCPALEASSSLILWRTDTLSSRSVTLTKLLAGDAPHCKRCHGESCTCFAMC
ncbi:hypothetical protein DPEC_G00044260 [Dallia pectoralis]|uniref:Uncharacterized protein n=1 Tax=Dallia pectoralis TaxID=75939 RepID=A0ACC2H9E8_DALPE|nr:hypothetical protein DPEC_G00044260 [Dallia pectoralis]